MLCADGDISSHSCTSWTREQKGQKNIRRKSLRPFPSIPLASRMLPLTTILLIRLNGGKSKDAPTNNKTKYFECTCQWDVWQRHYAPELSNTDRSWKTTMPLLFYIIVYSTKGSARWEIVEGRFGNVLNICRLSTILRMIKFLGVWTCLKSVFKETWTKQQHKQQQRKEIKTVCIMSIQSYFGFRWLKQNQNGRFTLPVDLVKNLREKCCFVFTHLLIIALKTVPRFGMKDIIREVTDENRTFDRTRRVSFFFRLLLPLRGILFSCFLRDYLCLHHFLKILQTPTGTPNSVTWRYLVYSL